MRALYLASTGGSCVIDDPRLDSTTERHKLMFEIGASAPRGDPVQLLERDPGLEGLVIELRTGWVERRRLTLARAALSRRLRVWLYWPSEEAIECVDRERLTSLWRHWAFIQLGRHVGLRWLRAVRFWERGVQVVRDVPPWRIPRIVARRVVRAMGLLPGPAGPHASSSGSSPTPAAPARRLDALERARAAATPVPFRPSTIPSAERRLPGCGVYLRTDFWSRIESGGSYGHTCYVAKELAAVTESFVCFNAQRYRLIDDFGLRQVVLDPPGPTSNEDDIVAATDYYVRLLRPALEALRPAYLYERLCLGNYAGALLSRALEIPYIVEYNGSEISMRRSFDGMRYVYEQEYLEAEALAFEQATMISVVSTEVKNSLLARGVDPARILVNPNGVDPGSYAPLDPNDKRELRKALGFSELDQVVGFTGTFGGWHGIDVLSAALPQICQRAQEARFLLIGDGNYKHLVDRAIAGHQLDDRVRCTGRVPQTEGARLLKACDVYVSPHSSHMVDSRFFGSPTKIFEYMALGGGIVASDLEQIGEVLSPAFAPAALADNRPAAVIDERSVLCTPGDVGEFVEGVVALVKRPDVARALGGNARNAAVEHYSWTQHVRALWAFLSGESPREGAAFDSRRNARQVELASVGASRTVASVGAVSGVALLTTGDRYKDEVQNQWDNDPAGSHYVEHSRPHTKEWFLEAETYRYGEYAPWMRETMEFDGHPGEDVLEIGGGMGTDLAAFASRGARVTDVDLSAGHLALAHENFAHRGLEGRFIHHDAETLPFDNESFDVVYSNGVLHHTPNTMQVVREIHRVLRPGGLAIVMMYAENSLHYWRNLVWAIGIKEDRLRHFSMGEIMSRAVERSERGGARPLVKVYTKKRLRQVFEDFGDIEIVQRQLISPEVPRLLVRIPAPRLASVMGWNLVVKARKPIT